MVVASYNVHKCIGTDRRFDPERTARVIREISPDVIALQEADNRFGDRAGLLDLARPGAGDGTGAGAGLGQRQGAWVARQCAAVQARHRARRPPAQAAGTGAARRAGRRNRSRRETVAARDRRPSRPFAPLALRTGPRGARHHEQRR
ncbi:endonuclease/exonuclease/phosphatase family protein [Mesorhizobium atlanticum]